MRLAHEQHAALCVEDDSRGTVSANIAAWLRLDARAGRRDLGRRVGLELLEVLAEHLRELAAFGSYASGSRHVERGSSSFASTPGTSRRHLEAEDLVGPVLDAVERRRRAPRAAARASRAIGIRSPSPNGPPVQPVLTSQTVDVVRRELLAEHPRVDARRLRQERRAEAGRERRLRLGDADLGAGELRREAGEEVEERLRRASAARSAAARRTRPRSA